MIVLIGFTYIYPARHNEPQHLHNLSGGFVAIRKMHRTSLRLDCPVLSRCAIAPVFQRCFLKQKVVNLPLYLRQLDTGDQIRYKMNITVLLMT